VLPHEEVVLGARKASSPIPVATHVRSTVLHSSIRIIRERGRFDAYAATLPRQHHEALFNLVVGVWVPMDIGLAHYEAANPVGFTPHEQYENGRLVVDRIGRTAFGLAGALARSSGATMWTALSNAQRMWDRVMLGGVLRVYRLGPKEARLEGYGAPLARIPYVRQGWRGMIAGIGELFCRKVYVTEIPRLCGGSSFGFRIAWA
jgi:hypothetical protein